MTAEPEEVSSASEEGKKELGKAEQVREFLLSGLSEEDIIARGFNKGTVRIVAYELEKQGLRQRPGRMASQVQKTLQTYSRGSPPEAIVEALEVPPELNGGFLTGMRFGMFSIISGIRIAQELSQIGVQQARPLVDMARDMRQGEMNAAKTASLEAAAAAAGQVQSTLMPVLAEMSGRMSSLERGTPQTGNPVGDMMVRTIEPLMQNLVGRFIPGAGGPSAPVGWTRRKE